MHPLHFLRHHTSLTISDVARASSRALQRPAYWLSGMFSRIVKSLLLVTSKFLIKILKQLKEQGDSVYHFEFDSSKNGDFGTGHRESGSSSITNDLQVPTMNSQRGLEIEDFFDPNESTSFAKLPMKYSSLGEFFDAWEELSSEGGAQTSTIDFEAELCEMRLSLLMEIEKRKQTEESLNSMKSKNERIKQGLYSAGIVLPANLTAMLRLT
ncbi:hypothetical protein Ahy_A03g014149 isoform A [Arachis hypogaea]|uniref:Uncharacterized protein n=1 Tax=Arachis hypogaea TaxID=3818 RepID=A0A445DXE1_ARAHY|nr:hypothetical protein Ahy_A03g014149 isoform A [Arachis hypogaea]